MATHGTYMSIPGLLAGADLSSSQYKPVQACSTAEEVKVATTAATDKILGILQNDPADGEPAEVAFCGVCKGLAGDTITYGAKLTCNSTGLAATTTDKDEIVGIALRGASSGDVFPVMLTRFTLSE